MVTVAPRRRKFYAQTIRRSTSVLTFAERSEAAKRGALSMTPAERSARTRKGWLKRKRALPKMFHSWGAGTSPTLAPWTGQASTVPQEVWDALPATAEYLHLGGSMGAATPLAIGNTQSIDEVVDELRNAIAADPNGDLIVDTAALLTGQPGDAFFMAIATGLIESAGGSADDVIRFQMIDKANTYIADQNEWTNNHVGGPVQGGSAADDQALYAALKAIPNSVGDLLANQLIANYRPIAMAGLPSKALTSTALGVRLHRTVEFLHEHRYLTGPQAAAADAAVNNWMITAGAGTPFNPATLTEQIPGTNIGTGAHVPASIPPLAGINAAAPGSTGAPVKLTATEIADRRRYIQALRHNRLWKVGGPNDTLTVYGGYSPSERAKRDAQRKALLDMVIAEAQNRGVQRRPIGQRRALITGGPAGAGKSFMLEEHADEVDGPWLVVNVDDITDRLIALNMVPTMPGLSPSESVHLARNEASLLRDELFARAVTEGWDTAYDTTMMTGALAQQAITDFHNNGYLDPDALFVSVDTARSIQSAEERWVHGVEQWLTEGDLSPVDGGRYVGPNSIARNVPHNDTTLPSGSAETFIDLVKAGTFNRALVIDNTPRAGNRFPRAVLMNFSDVDQADAQIATGASITPRTFQDKIIQAVFAGEQQRRSDGRSARGQGIPNPPTGASPPPTVVTPTTPAPPVTATGLQQTGNFTSLPSALTLQNFTADTRWLQFTSATGYAGTGGDVTRGNKVQKRIVTTLGKFSTQTITAAQIDTILAEWDKANKTKPISGQTPGQFNHFLYNTSVSSYNLAAGTKVQTFSGAPTTTPTPPVPQPTVVTSPSNLASLHGATTTLLLPQIAVDPRYRGLSASEQKNVDADYFAAQPGVNRTFQGPWTAAEADAYLNAYTGVTARINAQLAVTNLRKAQPTQPGFTGFLSAARGPISRIVVTPTLVKNDPRVQALGLSGANTLSVMQDLRKQANQTSLMLRADEIDAYLDYLVANKTDFVGANAALAAKIAANAPAPQPQGIVVNALENAHGKSTIVTLAQIIADPRYQALPQHFQNYLSSDESGGMGPQPWTGPWTAQEADAYLNAVYFPQPGIAGNSAIVGNTRNFVVALRTPAPPPPTIAGAVGATLVLANSTLTQTARVRIRRPRGGLERSPLAGHPLRRRVPLAHAPRSRPQRRLVVAHAAELEEPADRARGRRLPRCVGRVRCCLSEPRGHQDEPAVGR